MASGDFPHDCQTQTGVIDSALNAASESLKTKLEVARGNTVPVILDAEPWARGSKHQNFYCPSGPVIPDRIVEKVIQRFLHQNRAALAGTWPWSEDKLLNILPESNAQAS